MQDHEQQQTIERLRREVAELRAENERLRREVGRLGRHVDPNAQQAGEQRARRMRSWVGGLAYLAIVASIFSGVTGVGFIPVFLALLSGAIVCTTLALIWLTRWALREDGRTRQFTLGSIFFVTVFAAIYLGLVRWLVVESTRAGVIGAGQELVAFAGFAVLCLLLAAISIGLFLRMAEAFVWFAVWIVRRPRVRRWLARRRGTAERQPPE